ncbi:MAG: DNA polymerase III subunit delta [Kofleriaceae bacterium]
MAALVDQIAAGKLAPVYLLHSEQPVLVDRVLAALRDAVVAPALRAFNYDVIEGKPSATRIVAAAQTLPMMGPRRLVYVRDLAALPADEAPALLAYIAAPNPSTVLVCVTSKLDKRLKLYAQAAKAGVLHVLEAPRNPSQWIRAEADARQVRLEGRVVDRLVDAVGNDLSRLAMVLDQLALYAGDRAVTVDDVDELVADTRERSVFELTDAIGAGDLPGALAAVASLCDQRDSAIGVIAMLARHLRQLGQVHAHAGASKGELAQRVGAPPFVVDKLVAQARRYPAAHVARSTAALAAADRALKGDVTVSAPWSGAQVKTLGRPLAERVILEQLVTSIVAGAARR